MDRATWASTKDVEAMLRFACLRIPRRHLVLVLSQLITRHHRPRPEGPILYMAELGIAALRSWCFHELEGDELRVVAGDVRRWMVNGFDENWSPVDASVQELLRIARWRCAAPDPGLSWGVEDDAEGFIAFVVRCAQFIQILALHDVKPPAAGEVRSLISYPDAIARDWRPQLPLVIAGSQVLTVVDWQIVHVARLDAPFEVAPDVLVLRDELLRDAGPEHPRQRAERERVQALIDAGQARPPTSFVTELRDLDEVARTGSRFMLWAKVPEKQDPDARWLRVAVVVAIAIPVLFLVVMLVQTLPREALVWVFGLLLGAGSLLRFRHDARRRP